ncbi:hypothetical protein DN752_17810 [Echinicola strongylocentroti]|uniref:Abasic site processing protein n=1 Tax=Echinicola strongylocentroti TaxID=1795355 RepID=A0A2Z4IM98_9BACT|nr:SOS response-associated peptidase [Echinicola strongylocentroti]AWW31837.1 hypothetical protein DN752_17810 [Echinicola strongylocentroti]
MCGRYGLQKDKEILEDKIKARAIGAFRRWKGKSNIAPSQLVPITTLENPDEIDCYHFGLVPHWAKDKNIGYKMINARSETVTEKASFKPLFNKGKRCLVYADGFYEWKREGKDKIPFRFFVPDREIFTFAGLWSRWKTPEGEDYNSFTIITTTPNELTAPIHDRMPVILTEEDAKVWMDPDQNPNDLEELLSPYPADAMDSYEVSTDINNTRNESPDLMEPLKK